MIRFQDEEEPTLVDLLVEEEEREMDHMVWLDRQKEKWSLEEQGAYEAGYR